MDVIGTGFLARHLAAAAADHPDVVALAAGVSWAGGTAAADFGREESLVRETAGQCRRGGRTLLFFSTASAGVYGADRPGREDDPPVPRNPYGAHKLGLERIVQDSGARHLVLRLGHVTGPGQPAHQLVPTLVRLLREGSVTIQRRATRDLVGVADVVRIVDELLGAGIRDQIVNVASGQAVPVEEIVEHLQARLGVVATHRYEDTGAAHQVSLEKLRSLLPATRMPEFGPGYFRGVLDGYVSSDLTRPGR